MRHRLCGTLSIRMQSSVCRVVCRSRVALAARVSWRSLPAPARRRTRRHRPKRPDAQHLAPYVPTPQEVVDRMLQLAEVDKSRRRLRPGLRGRPDSDHRCQDLRRPRGRRRYRPAADCRSQRQRQAGGRDAPGHLQAAGRDDDRRVGRHRRDAVSAVGVEPQAAADSDPPAQTRRAHRRRTPSAWATGRPDKVDTFTDTIEQPAHAVPVEDRRQSPAVDRDLPVATRGAAARRSRTARAPCTRASRGRGCGLFFAAVALVVGARQSQRAVARRSRSLAVRPAALRPRARAERARSRGARRGVLRARPRAPRRSLAGRAASAASASAIPRISTPRISICSAPAACSSCWSTTRTSGGEDTLAGWLLAPAPIPHDSRAAERASPSSRRASTCARISPCSARRCRPRSAPTICRRGPRPRRSSPATGRASWCRCSRPCRARRAVDLDRRPAAGARAASIAVQGAVRAASFGTRVHHVTHGVEEREQELRVLATLMERIEREPVEQPAAAAAAAPGCTRPGAHRPRRFGGSRGWSRSSARVTTRSSARSPRCCCSARSSPSRSSAGARAAGPRCRVWLTAVAEYEALSALATYAAEHPEDPFPEIVEGAPLLRRARRWPIRCCRRRRPCPTTCALGGRRAPHLLLVSGSNMSGKSTLLRTVGLERGARAGRRAGARPATAHEAARASARRCASRTRCRQADRASSPRSRASARSSSLRLQAQSGLRSGPVPARRAALRHQLARSAARREPVFSSGLIELGAIGLVTTHDLALTAIADALEGRAANVHFEDRFENGVLTFDYRLRPGVVRIEQRDCADALGRAWTSEVRLGVQAVAGQVV